MNVIKWAFLARVVRVEPDSGSGESAKRHARRPGQLRAARYHIYRGSYPPPPRNGPIFPPRIAGKCIPSLPEHRASKVIGSSVVNGAEETIGEIEDLLVSPDGKQPYAVLSVGGFLGMGTRLIVVPYDTLTFTDKKVMLPGGTKDGLKMLPEFKYTAG
jgi:hypothetical protein